MTDTPGQPDPQALLKQQAAERAVEFIKPGMVVGLGTGSTAIFATRRIASLIADGSLAGVVGFATSDSVRQEAERLGIPMIGEDMPRAIDVTIDGADEVDPEMNLIKGGGGALTREKIVAQASQRVIIIVDETKPSDRLGTLRAVPVEVLYYGWRSQARFIESLGATAIDMRPGKDGEPFVTDSGNRILDCAFGPIPDSRKLAETLASRAGIVEHGLFIDVATDLIVAGSNGIEHVEK